VRTAAAGIGSGKSAAAAGGDNVWQLAALLGEVISIRRRATCLTPLWLQASSSFESVHTLADDPALIIYTSGTTGNPKGTN
jgi:acyl-coenzyme A synthetase/AMP-(fatty) acid ligase